MFNKISGFGVLSRLRVKSAEPHAPCLRQLPVLVLPALVALLVAPVFVLLLVVLLLLLVVLVLVARAAAACCCSCWCWCWCCSI